MKYGKNQKGVSLIGMLLAIIIIALLCYFAVKTYFRKTSVDEATKKEMAKQGIKVDDKISTIDSAKTKVKSFNKSAQDRLKQYKSP